MKRVTLAYSGGPSSGALLRHLASLPETEVVTVTLDLGQRDALADVRDRALDLGAMRAHVVDARAEFADDFIAPAIRAGLAADPPAALAASLSRPLIARHVAAIARMEDSAVVAVGGGADGRSRFARVLQSMAPPLELLARPAVGPQPAVSAAGVVEFEDNLWSRRVLHVSGGAAPVAGLHRRPPRVRADTAAGGENRHRHRPRRARRRQRRHHAACRPDCQRRDDRRRPWSRHHRARRRCAGRS